MIKRFMLFCLIVLTGLTLCTGLNAAEKVKIGFIVKQPEEPWFQLEWKFAEEAAKEKGFELIKISGVDGPKVLAAIDNLATIGAKGFVICTPDVKLGPAIMMRAKKHGMKVVAVDDRFMKGDKPMEEVKYLGISAYKIGEKCGEEAVKEMKKRGWKESETGVCIVTFDELDTARDRTDGEYAAIVAAGFPKNQIFKAPQKTSDVPGAFDGTNILLTQQTGFKNWIVTGMNDSATIGGIRAMEGRGFKPANIIGIGINGTDCITEFKKPEQTGFYGSMLLSAKQHGYDTASMLYEWIVNGKEPPADTRTVGVFITRDTWEQIYKEQGL